MQNQSESDHHQAQLKTRIITKRKTKNYKLHQAKSVFICECSKIYLSYPSLYLHAKLKHNVKLTSRIEESMFKKIQRKGKTYFTFYFSAFLSENKNPQQYLQFPKHFQISEQTPKLDHIQENSSINIDGKHIDSFQTQKDYNKKNQNFDLLSVKFLIQHYLQTTKTVFSYQNNPSEFVLASFAQYVEKMVTISRHFQNFGQVRPKTLVENLPLFLNEFLSFYLPQNPLLIEHNSTGENTEIQVMKAFADWLRQHNFTNLIVVNNF